MITTLRAIYKRHPCIGSWLMLLDYLGKDVSDEEPLRIATILESNGFNDALWALRAVTGHDREIRLFTVWCARQVQHLMTDPRSVAALDVAERFARGTATGEELRAARVEALAAVGGADRAALGLVVAAEAAGAAAWAVVEVVATRVLAAAGEARGAAGAWETMHDAQHAELRRVCAVIEAGGDPYPAAPISREGQRT